MVMLREVLGSVLYLAEIVGLAFGATSLAFGFMGVAVWLGSEKPDSA